MSCLTAVISLLKLIQSTSMRPGFLRLEIKIKVFSRFGAKLWNATPNEFRQLSQGAFKIHFHDLLLSIMETEDDYVEVPNLLQKTAQSVATTYCTNN